MSYILDALNKSEKERAKKRTPNINSLQDNGGAPPTRTRSWLLGLGFLALVNSVLVYFYFESKQMPGPTTEPVVSETVRIDPVNRRPTAVEVTAHIYSSDPLLRMVKINGKTRHEGDEISAGTTLIAITESGILLESGGSQYTQEILEDWAD